MSSFVTESSKAYFIRTIIPFLLLQFSVGLCSSLQATFYPIEASSKGATASQFGAVFGIIHLSLFMFGNLIIYRRPATEQYACSQDRWWGSTCQYGE